MVRTSISAALVALLLGTDARSAPSEPHRYPYDPACAWGRLADGRGLIVRCLTREESERLAKPPAAAGPVAVGTAPVQSSSNGAASSGPVAPGASSSAVAAPGVPRTTANTPVAPTGLPPNVAPTAPAAPAATTDSNLGTSPTLKPDAFAAELVGVVADDGELPLAKKKLAIPLGRYEKCVADFGGLTATIGQVAVRFLVRERGRAEGVSVEKFQGMSEAAANCIAQVIDRRPTGAPEAPVVGATVTIRIRKRAAK